MRGSSTTKRTTSFCGIMLLLVFLSWQTNNLSVANAQKIRGDLRTTKRHYRSDNNEDDAPRTLLLERTNSNNNNNNINNNHNNEHSNEHSGNHDSESRRLEYCNRRRRRQRQLNSSSPSMKDSRKGGAPGSLLRKGSKSSKATSGGGKSSKKARSESGGQGQGQQAADGNRDLVSLTISIQPAFWAIPMYAAKELGWFEELGIDAIFEVYSSGGPQVAAAVENDAWQIGMAGSVPNVIAGDKSISTIGISNDESAATEVIGAPGVESFPPETLTEKIFASTPSSTGDLLMRLCLENANVEFDEDLHLLGAGQGDIISALQEGSSSYGSLWPPNTYQYKANNQDVQVFCTGEDVSFPILGGLMVQNDWGLQNQDLVAKVLAAYLRGVTLVQNTAAKDLVMEVSKSFYEFVGISISEDDMQRDMALRPIFNLDAQLAIMRRNFINDGTSDVDLYYDQLSDFLFERGVIERNIGPSEFVTSQYMEAVSKDPELRRFAYMGAIDPGCSA